ncbi:MarR family EPS-associated transcriptional regulator [Thiomicrospira sp. R3]|uniref:MarR family EPS-associated transcriptional regulator n=1 Tax=Thiomicrospira sp. R3 TaxID=3035472 RepID=UPI00259B13BF|nr:MarR family EPS-associated transcriptional regulator [Thiomicrospira sp. R3]WFE68776.1 MarR family EPS-associated transcriptional regulator [Thiomicrospira sp. R3]WFE68834.1 MarR family EPS-associated transcriptional regulator [Thiomicrospira sp. R3]
MNIYKIKHGNPLIYGVEYTHVQKLSKHKTMDSATQLEALRQVTQQHNQRTLAKNLGFSVGKTNYLLKALIEKGLVKVERFAHSDNKLNYRYLLTPKGIAQRIALTETFIQRKKQEYDALQQELIQLHNQNHEQPAQSPTRDKRP